MFVTLLTMSGVLVPLTRVNALSPGDLIKVSGVSSIYYIDNNNKRYVFPNEQTYFSWYNDFSMVRTVSQSQLYSYGPPAGNVKIRPGTKLVKIRTHPNVYAVEAGGTLKLIPNESTATTLYGSSWARRVIDIPDAFFTNYNISNTNVSSNAYPQGSMVRFSGDSSVYYINSNGTASKMGQYAISANRLDQNNIIIAPYSVTRPSLSAEIYGVRSDITDVSASGGGSTPAPCSGTGCDSIGSGLNISLAANTPNSATVPDGAAGVEVAKFNFTASNDGSVTITELSIRRSGIGDASEISRVFIYEGSTRLTSGKTVMTSSNKSTFSNLSIVVGAGTTRALSVVINDKTGGGTGNHAFGIDTASDVKTNGASVNGMFPMKGNTMSFSAVSVGKIDVESSGKDYTRKVGEKNVEVGSFRIYADNTEDAKLESITLYNDDDDEVLSNLKLYRASTLLASANGSGRNFTFKLDNPYAIKNGESVSFTVRGDIGGKDNDTAKLYVKYRDDVKVKGDRYNFYLSIDVKEGGSSSNSYVEEVDSSQQENTITVEAGQLTVSDNGPSASDIAKDSDDVVLLDFSMTVYSDIIVEKSTINLSGSTNLTSNDIDDLELVCNNQVKLSWDNPSANADNSSSDNWDLLKGISNCQIRIDISNTANNSDTIVATIKDLTSSTYWTFKDSNNDDILTDIVPSGDIIGQTMSINVPSLNVSQSSSPSSGLTYVKRTSDAEVVGFVLRAGDSSDIKITSITLEANLEDSGDINSADWAEGANVREVISQVQLFDNGNSISNTKSISGTSVTFDGMDWDIPAGQTKELNVKVGISSTAPRNNNNDLISIGIPANGIEAEYGGGTSISAIGLPVNTGTTPSVYQIVTESGTLSVALAPDTPSSNLVILGKDEIPVTKIEFTANNEDMIIRKLRIKTHYFIGSTVISRDADIATSTLTQTLSNAKVTGGDGSWSYDTEYVYIDVDNNDNISAGDIRVTPRYDYIAGSVVASGNDDVATGVISEALSNARVTGADGNWNSSSEYVYISADADIGVNDTRVTARTDIDGNEYDKIRLQYTNSDDNEETKTVSLSRGVADFSGLDIFVEKDDDAVVTVLADLNAKSEGADNESVVGLVFDWNDNFRSVASNADGTGGSGKTDYSVGTADLAGQAMYAFETFPIIEFASDTPDDDYNPDTLTWIGKINVQASNGQELIFSNANNNSIIMEISANSASTYTGAITLRDQNSDILDVANVSGGRVTFDFSTKNFIVPEGSTGSLNVYADTTGVSSIRVWLSGASADNIDWGVNNSGNYNYSDIIFKSSVYGESLAAN